MGQVRNDTGETRVLPALDYAGFAPDQVLEVRDEDAYHWAAGGFTVLSPYPVPFRLYPNHAHDPLAFALPEPDPADPSAIAVGVATPAPAASGKTKTPAASAPTTTAAPAAPDAEEA